jgi:hypothetical protein
MTSEDLTIPEWGYYTIEPITNSWSYSLELNSIIYDINWVSNSNWINYSLENNLDLWTITY